MMSLAGIEGNGQAYDITRYRRSRRRSRSSVLLTAIQARLPRPAVAALVLNLVAVVFSIVHTGEHYVFDALMGVVFAVAAWLVVRTLEVRATQHVADASMGQVKLPS